MPSAYETGRQYGGMSMIAGSCSTLNRTFPLRSPWISWSGSVVARTKCRNRRATVTMSVGTTSGRSSQAPRSASGVKASRCCLVGDTVSQDHEEMSGLQVPVRTSAVSLGVSGLLVAAGTPWHPDIFARPLDQVVREFGAWTLLHVLAGVVVILALVGAAGLVAAHDGRLGRLGQVGLIVTAVGGMMTAS